MKNRLITLTLLPFILFMSGCSLFHNGDTLDRQLEGGQFVPDSASRLFIKPVKGVDADPAFTDELVRRLKSRVNLDGRLSVTEEEKTSDLTLAMKVTVYGEQDISFDSAGRPVKRRISLTLGITLAETKSGREIIRWKEVDSGIVFEMEKSILREVYRSLAESTSEKILSVILTGWESDKSDRRHAR